MSAFFAMGGYAAYVWPAYGLAFVVVVGLGLYVYRSLKAAEDRLRALEAEQSEKKAEA